LTTRHMAHVYQNQLVSPIDGAAEGPVEVHRGGWLYRLLHDQESEALGFPPATAWAPSHALNPVVWGHGDSPDPSLSHARRGWAIHAFHLDSQGTESSELIVVHGVYLRQGAWIVFLIAAIGGLWLGGITRRWLAVY